MRKIKTMAALLVCLSILCLLPAAVHAENEQPASSPALPATAENEDGTNPVMTPENQAKLEAYEAKLRAEMEEDGVSLMATGETAPTFNQYLANYNYNENCYNLYKNDFKLPSRSYVESLSENGEFQAAVVAWQLATFELSDIAEHAPKEIGFYESILFDVLYQGKDIESISGQMNKVVKSVQSSTIKSVAEFTKENLATIPTENIMKMTDEEFDKWCNAFDKCESIENVTKIIGNVSKVLKYVDNVEELIYKLAKAEAIARNSNETAKILLKMKDATSNWALKEALSNMILVCSNQVSEETIINIFTTDMVVSELTSYVYDEVWKDVIKDLNLVGLAISAGQDVGKTFSNLLFSTEETIENYYSLKALCEFEDALKSALSSYERSWLNSRTDANSLLFNEAYKLLLQTDLYGIKASQKFSKIVLEKGVWNKIVSWLHPDRNESYMNSLSNIQKSIETTIEFMYTVGYNGYIANYGGEAANVLNITEETPKHTEQEIDETVDEIIELSFESNNVTIKEGKTLERDMHTYGNLYFEGGTLDLNGHTLTVDGNILQSGGAMDINNGKLIVGGDYRIQRWYKDEYDDQWKYGECDGMLYMDNLYDYIEVNGDFYIQTSTSYGYGSSASKNILTDGTIIVKGDFWQLGDKSFLASNNHKVVIDGSSDQYIYFESPNSNFNDFSCNNSSNITFGGYLSVNKFNSDFVADANSVEIINMSDLNGHDVTLNCDVNITGYININEGTLTITGNILQSDGTMDINNGKLIVGGDYRIQNKYVDDYDNQEKYSYCDGKLLMDNFNDHVLVNGNFHIAGACSSGSYFTGGILEIKGNFEQLTGVIDVSLSGQSFVAKGNHKVILSGTAEQYVFFEHPDSSHFANIEITNAKGSITFTSKTHVTSSLSQSGGAKIVNPENVTLSGSSAFEDRGTSANKLINAYVGNAENVIPTWKDCEVYDAQLAPTVYPYDISSINLLDSTGTELEKAPVNASFVVNVDVMKKQSRSGRDYVFVAVYDKAGALLNIDYVQADFSEGRVHSFGFNVPAQTSEIGEIKAFVWHSFSDPQPLAESKTL